jgi:uncharacterized membrane protein
MPSIEVFEVFLLNVEGQFVSYFEIIASQRLRVWKYCDMMLFLISMFPSNITITASPSLMAEAMFFSVISCAKAVRGHLSSCVIRKKGSVL